MGLLSGTGILDGTGILSGRGILFQSGLLVPPSIDPDAAAYIAAVEAAGATVTGAQRTFINDFYVSAKEDYYTSLKRLYLPIWGVAAANAIDMITLASGTFNGGVTHAAGYVQGNGSTGYFSLETNYTGLGLSDTSCMQFAGLKADTGITEMTLIGVAPAVGTCFDLKTIGGAGDRYTAHRGLNNSVTVTVGSNSQTGLFIGNIDNTNRRLTRRITSGVTHSTDATTGGSLPTETITAMRLGAPDLFYHTGEIILWGVGTSLTQTQAEDFTLHLKTLWEGCTGLTLP